MRTRIVILAVAVCLAAASACWAFDTIKTESESIRGTVIGMSPLKVTIQQGAAGGLEKEVPVNEIETIYYDDEPTQLKTARLHISSGRYEDALSTLGGIDTSEISREVVKQDVDFYKAHCTARLALGGNGKVLDAARQMSAFLSANKGSYHFLEATEAMGDLAVANGSYDQAEVHYRKLAVPPWPDYKMKAGVALGRARLAQGNTAGAKQAFEVVLGMDAGDDLAKAQHLAATLGKARCLAAEGAHAQAIKVVQDILARADPEDVELQARAHNTLGTALRKAGRDKEALMAFLHVHLLYFAVPEAHAEALANLVELWKAVHKTERAVQAQRMLEERYANSRWNKQGASP